MKQTGLHIVPTRKSLDLSPISHGSADSSSSAPPISAARSYVVCAMISFRYLMGMFRSIVIKDWSKLVTMNTCEAGCFSINWSNFFCSVLFKAPIHQISIYLGHIMELQQIKASGSSLTIHLLGGLTSIQTSLLPIANILRVLGATRMRL